MCAERGREVGQKGITWKEGKKGEEGGGGGEGRMKAGQEGGGERERGGA